LLTFFFSMQLFKLYSGDYSDGETPQSLYTFIEIPL